MKMKSKLVDIITCTLCKLEVTMDLNYNIPKTDTGIVISGLTCMNCQSEVTHDITRIQKPCSGFAHLKWEDLENLKEYRSKYRQMKSWNDAVPMFCEHCSNDGGYEKCRCFCHKDLPLMPDYVPDDELQQKSSDAPRQMNGSQDAPSTNSPSITQSKGRSNSSSVDDFYDSIKLEGESAKEFEKQDKTPLTPEQKKSLDDDLKYYYDTVDES